MRAGLGLSTVRPTERDLAVNELMRRITVASETRSYVISVATTARDPEEAPRLTNAIALEYLRGQMLQQLADTRAAAERELAQLSSIYGVRHPSYVLARARLDALQDRLTALRDGPPDDDTVRLVIGQSFVAAEKTLTPTGPPIILILGLTAGAALGIGIWLALRLASNVAMRLFIARHLRLLRGVIRMFGSTLRRYLGPRLARLKGLRGGEPNSDSWAQSWRAVLRIRTPH
jgi:hypothetical protein